MRLAIRKKPFIYTLEGEVGDVLLAGIAPGAVLRSVGIAGTFAARRIQHRAVSNLVGMRRRITQ